MEKLKGFLFLVLLSSLSILTQVASPYKCNKIDANQK